MTTTPPPDGDQPRSTPRSDGVTASERKLQELCEQSFLKLWSYVGVYRDQGKLGAGDGKELCDVLVVFGDTVVLFSDKDCAFPDTGDVDVDWGRWKRRAITKSIEQLRGAEKWVRDLPNRLYLDRACTIPFPLPLPGNDRIRTHRIVVARGAGPRCAAKYGGSPSLPLFSHRVAQLSEQRGHPLPAFSITPGPPGEVVHILDEYSLDIILSALDTISDFLRYLERKENFVSSAAFSSAAGEEELLAYYLQNWNAQAELDFTLPDVREMGVFGAPMAAHLADGGWMELERSESWQAWKAFNAPSYIWDEIIASFAGFAFEGRLWSSDESTLAFHERILRMLAAEPRARRRILSIALVQHLQRATKLERSGRVITAEDARPMYVFVSVAVEHGESHELYRKRRQELIVQYAAAAKHHYPDALDVVAIGVEPLTEPGHSFDIVALEGRDWSEEEAAHAKALVEEGGILAELNPSRPFSSEKDLVHARHQLRIMETAESVGVGRNDPCPCGSGRKFKKCHGAY
jgi:hypothetical protein